jgi:SpoIVB peptidase S55
MIKKGFLPAFAALVFMLAIFSMALAKGEFFKIEDLQPGMKGVGRTCYQGSKPEEFQVEILGVLHGVNPGASAVLARFSGSLLEKTGIFEGMSGSPVYINGKLLGAVAYSFSFTKESIGGITPITQMVEAFNENVPPTSGIKIVDSRPLKYELPMSGNQNLATGLTIATDDVIQQPLLAAFGGHSLIPIATPLSLGGFHSETLRAFAPRFRAMGMSILQGAGGTGSNAAAGSKQDSDNAPMEPGSNIVIPLVRGDLEVSAGGTVTYVDGNRLYAFGHSLLQLGFTELPIHKGRAIMVVPSLESSFKILEIGEQVGTIRQDRGAGIYGIVGEKPRIVPLQIHLTTSRGTKREFKYEIVRDSLLTPLLVDTVVYNTIITSERAQGSAALSVKGKITIKNEEPVEVDNRFSSDSNAPTSAALSIALPTNYLMSAGYSNLDLQTIDLEISAQENDRAAILDSIRFNRTEVHAGESLDLEISYKKANGEFIQDTYPIKIPANASPGALTLLVADGTTLMALDEKEEGENLIPRDLSQLIKFINNLRKNDHLYVRFFRQEPGAVIKGEGLPGLPPSILSILKSERKVGAVTSINTSTLMEYEMPRTEYMVSGAKAMRLIVRP